MNQSFQKFARLSVIAAAVIAAPAFAATSVDANAEFDTGVQSGDVKAGNGTIQGGRIETNISGRAEMNGGFVAGRGTVILAMNGGSTTNPNTSGTNLNNAALVDDAWVQAGTSAFDVKLGRFEASNLYPTPGDAFRIGGVYQTHNLRGRSLLAAGGGSIDDRMHLALTVNLAPGTSLEVGVVDKKDVSNVTANGGSNGYKGVRPTLGFSAGALSGRVGFESGKTVDGANEASFSGMGGTVAFNLGNGVTLRANAASAKTKYAAGDKKQTSVLLGADVGALTISFESGKNDDAGAAGGAAAPKVQKVSGLFAAYSIPLFGIKGATFQPAVGTGTKDNDGTKVTVTKVGARVHYDF